MKESEAKGFIQGKLDCMDKCGVFNKEDNISDNECDNCEYCYSQGNFGEQKEAFQTAINALEKQIPKNPEMDISDDVCEWKVKSNYYVTECSHDTDVMYGLKQDFKFCPYCGKKIKVVE